MGQSFDIYQKMNLKILHLLISMTSLGATGEKWFWMKNWPKIRNYGGYWNFQNRFPRELDEDFDTLRISWMNWISSNFMQRKKNAYTKKLFRFLIPEFSLLIHIWKVEGSLLPFILRLIPARSWNTPPQDESSFCKTTGWYDPSSSSWISISRRILLVTSAHLSAKIQIMIG